MTFLSVEQFENLKQETIYKWRDVPTGIIFKIEDIVQIKTKKGDATVLCLSDHDGDQFKAWATSVIKEDLKNRKGTCYIKSMGKTQSKTNPEKFYYQYELVEDLEHCSV